MYSLDMPTSLWCPFRRTIPRYSRSEDELDIHIEFEGVDDPFPSLLCQRESQRKKGDHDTKFSHELPSSFIGVYVVHDGRPGWTVIGSDPGNGSYELKHPVFRGGVVKSGVPRSEVVQGYQDQIYKGQRLLDAAHKVLPACAFREDLVKLVYCATTQKHDYLSMIVGPCLPLARAIAVATLSTQLIAFAVGHATVACSDTMPPTYPAWLQLAALPLIAARGIAEWWMLTHALSYFGRYTEAFEILGHKVPFCIWLGVYGVASVCNYLDLFTDSCFTSVLWKMTDCNRVIPNIWNQIWEHSLLFFMPVPNLQCIAVVSWCLSLIQIAAPIIRTLRRSDLRGDTQHVAGVANSDNTGLCCGQQINHDAVLLGLADASGLASLQNLALVDTYNITTEIDPRFNKNFGYNVDNLSNQMLERLFLSGILETCIQTNQQGTLYAMSVVIMRRAGEVHVQFWQLVSLLISAVACCFRLMEIMMYVDIANATLKLAADHADALCNESISYLNGIRRKKRMVVAGCPIVIVCILYAAAKVAMAHVCTDAVWNITGCVRLHV